VFNWSDYIHEDALSRFEGEFNCKVVYDNYSSDSELETRLATAAGSDPSASSIGNVAAERASNCSAHIRTISALMTNTSQGTVTVLPVYKLGCS